MPNENTQSLTRFRQIAFWEGISLLVLLFIAMPLKYFAGLPKAVNYVGWAHGILFVFYMFFLLLVWINNRWSFGKVIVAFLASLLPFGTFLLEKRLKREETLQVN